MRRPLLHRGAAAVLVLALGTMGACGGDDSSGGAQPTSAAGDDGGDGKLLGICELVTGEELSAIVDGALTASPNPGGGCLFTQDEDFKLPSVSFGEQPYTEDNGGLTGAQAGLEAVITGGTSTDLDLGEGAVIVTGNAFGGEKINGSGLIHVGDTLVQVDLSQGSDYDEAKVTQLLTDLLTLVASKG